MKNYTDGDIAVSYEDGKRCREDIYRYLDQGESVALDFEGVDHALCAFLDPVIGDLILERGDDAMKQIIVRNAKQSIIDKIKTIKDGESARTAFPGLQERPGL